MLITLVNFIHLIVFMCNPHSTASLWAGAMMRACSLCTQGLWTHSLLRHIATSWILITFSLLAPYVCMVHVATNMWWCCMYVHRVSALLSTSSSVEWVLYADQIITTSPAQNSFWFPLLWQSQHATVLGYTWLNWSEHKLRKNGKSKVAQRDI